jgi:hypothetical protein
MRAIVVACALVVMGGIARADQPKTGTELGGPQAVVYDASSAFDFIKTLGGEWVRAGDDEHAHGSTSKGTIFRVTAAGSSVLETIFPGQDSEMLTIYHMDGDKLLLTHYCALQNAPILRFEKSDKPGEIKFVFHGGTNFDPASDMHVHEGVMRIKDANTIESTFVAFSDGKARPMIHSTMKRKAAK